MKMPKVSVIMSVYNGARYLREAIDSVLSQTFQDFEFIIINDGSTDDTGEILASYRDPRLVLVQQENMGLTKSLNRGIGMARGKYVARQDADDISLPRKLELQVEYLERNRDVGIVGCRCYLIDEGGDIKWAFNYPLNGDELREDLWVTHAIVVGAAMVPRRILDEVGYYDEMFTYAQDYDLTLRIAEVARMHNLEGFLYKVRQHKDQISVVKAREQRRFAVLASINALRRKVDKVAQRVPNLKERKNLGLDYSRLAFLYYLYGQWGKAAGSLYMAIKLDRGPTLKNVSKIPKIILIRMWMALKRAFI